MTATSPAAGQYTPATTALPRPTPVTKISAKPSPTSRGDGDSKHTHGLRFSAHRIKVSPSSEAATNEGTIAINEKLVA